MSWFTEKLYASFSQSMAVSNKLHDSHSGRQHIEIYETVLFGRMLALDGAVQLTQRDHHIYHELIAHVPIFAHGSVSDVLILGGGDGGALREVLKHPVEHVTLVEIDRDVLDLSREYFPYVSAGAFDDPRVEVVIGDAADFVARDKRRFDLIIVDSTDPIGVGETVFTRRFYMDCRARLRSDGAIVAQGGAPLFREPGGTPAHDPFRSVFGPHECFVAPVPSYPTGMVMLRGAALQDWSLNPPLILTRKRLQRSGVETRHYCAETHRGAFEVLRPSTLPGQSPESPLQQV